MKYKFIPVLLFVLFFFSAKLSAQITNLELNGSSTSATMTSGDTITWTYNVSPAGASTLIEIWFDVNGNGTIDPGTDVLFQSFIQTDGDTGGNNGPADMDGTVNGAVLFSSPIGLAPGKYIMKFTEGGTSLSVLGTVSHLSSPAHTISGTVTPPSDKSAANIIVEAKRSDKYQPNLWDAVTDANGNYRIEMNADTAGNPWQIALVSNPFPPDIISPSEHDITISGNPPGLDFSFLVAAAQVDGSLKDENGNPLPNYEVALSRIDSGSANNFYVSDQTDASGLFTIGILSGDLISGRVWDVSSVNGNSEITTTTLEPTTTIQALNAGDSVFENMILYKVNSQIQGRVTIDGSAPGYSVEIEGDNAPTMPGWGGTGVVYGTEIAFAMCDASTGNFTLPVTNKISTYHLGLINFDGSGYNIPSTVIAHAGDTGVLLNLTPTAVKDHTPAPREFILAQNYPNPFNPTTQIVYQLAAVSHVMLKVYNVLGEEVATLVNEKQDAGTHAVKFDGSKLPSGIYFYRIAAGNFSAVKKLVLIK